MVIELLVLLIIELFLNCYHFCPHSPTCLGHWFHLYSIPWSDAVLFLSQPEYNFSEVLLCVVMFFGSPYHLLGSHHEQLRMGDDGRGFLIQSEVKLRHLIHFNGRRDTSNNDHTRRSRSHQPRAGTSCGFPRRAAEAIAASSESSLADRRGASNSFFSA